MSNFADPLLNPDGASKPARPSFGAGTAAPKPNFGSSGEPPKEDTQPKKPVFKKKAGLFDSDGDGEEEGGLFENQPKKTNKPKTSLFDDDEDAERTGPAASDVLKKKTSLFDDDSDNDGASPAEAEKTVAASEEPPRRNSDLFLDEEIIDKPAAPRPKFGSGGGGGGSGGGGPMPQEPTPTQKATKSATENTGKVYIPTIGGAPTLSDIARKPLFANKKQDDGDDEGLFSSTQDAEIKTSTVRASKKSALFADDDDLTVGDELNVDGVYIPSHTDQEKKDIDGRYKESIGSAKTADADENIVNEVEGDGVDDALASFEDVLSKKSPDDDSLFGSSSTPAVVPAAKPKTSELGEVDFAAYVASQKASTTSGGLFE